MRASLFTMGPMLARYGKVVMPMPGGCTIGKRPIDLHLKAFQLMGAKGARPSDIDAGIVNLSANPLRGAKIYFDIVSVGATINAMLAACKAEGTTEIYRSVTEIASAGKSDRCLAESAEERTHEIVGCSYLRNKRSGSLICTDRSGVYPERMDIDHLDLSAQRPAKLNHNADIGNIRNILKCKWSVNEHCSRKNAQYRILASAYLNLSDELFAAVYLICIILQN